MKSLRSRHLVPELMDDPQIEPTEHRRALAGLRRINKWSSTARHLAGQMLRIAQRTPRARWRILDVGCGSGDVLLALSRHLRPHLRCQFVGWDLSPQAISEATKHSENHDSSRLGPVEVDFEVRNIFDLEKSVFQNGEAAPFDLVYCSLFLHHFNLPQSVELLRTMKRLAATAVFVDDLRRTVLGYYLARIGTRLLSRSPVVHFDGPQSVRAAYVDNEVKELARLAGLWPVQLRHHWPERFTLFWENHA